MPEQILRPAPGPVTQHLCVQEKHRGRRPCVAPSPVASVEGETETGWWMGEDPSHRAGSTPYREEMAGAQKQRRGAIRPRESEARRGMTAGGEASLGSRMAPEEPWPD
jgi:hypothetical protein